MSEQLPAEVVGRLEEAISNVDRISLKVAQMVGIFDKLFLSGSFDVDKFENEVERQVELDKTERMLLQRALLEIKKAKREAEENVADPKFLEKTTISLDEYSERPTVLCYPLFPGVAVIFLKSKDDAAQFSLDTETATLKALRRKYLSDTNQKIALGTMELGDFQGMTVSPKSLGLPEENSFCILVLVKEGADNKVLNQVLKHEYFHFIEKIIRLHFHKYFGNTDFTTAEVMALNFERIPAEVRSQLVAAIGPLKKAKSRSPEKASIDTERDPLEVTTALFHERRLLDEIRAHALGNNFIVPAQRQTTGLTFDQDYPIDLSKFDLLMAERYFHVQLRILALLIRGREAVSQGLAIICAAVSLAQAVRLLDTLIGTIPLDLEDVNVQKKIASIRSMRGNPSFDFLDYKIGDTELISAEEVAKYVPELPTD